MELTATNKKSIMKTIKTNLTWNKDKCNQIALSLSKAFSDKIKTGQVNPKLNPRVIQFKKLKGYSKPDAPLFGTGNLADSLKLGSCNDDEMTVVSNAKVKYGWHTTHRAKGVPKRVVLTHREASKIVKDVLSGKQG